MDLPSPSVRPQGGAWYVQEARMNDITVQILKDIRSSVQELNARVDQTNARLDQTNESVDALRDELGRRIVESELRTATALSDLAGSVREMTHVLRAQHDLRPRLERCEADIAELKRRTPAA